RMKLAVAAVGVAAVTGAAFAQPVGEREVVRAVPTAPVGPGAPDVRVLGGAIAVARPAEVPSGALSIPQVLLERLGAGELGALGDLLGRFEDMRGMDEGAIRDRVDRVLGELGQRLGG